MSLPASEMLCSGAIVVVGDQQGTPLTLLKDTECRTTEGQKKATHLLEC
jgi:hypothetical protein